MASLNYYLSLDNFKGESKVKGHSGEIELLSFSWGRQNNSPRNSGTGTKQSVHLPAIFLSKKSDSTTPQIMRYCATGKHIEKGRITVEQVQKDGTGKPYLILELEDIFIPNVQIMPEDMRGGLPMESFSLDYGKIKYTYIT